MSEQDAELFVDCLNTAFAYERAPGRFRFGLEGIIDMVKKRLK